MALLLGLIGVVAFSFSLPATRVAVEELDATFVGLGRAVVGAALAAVVLLAARLPVPGRRTLARLGLVVLGVVVGFPLFTALALRELSSAHGAVIVGLLPAATAVMAVARAGERPSPAFWVASLGGLAAVLVFAAAQGAGLPGGAVVFALLAVALGALGYAEGGALARDMGGWQVICWALVLSAPILVPATLTVAARGDLSGGADAWLGFAYVGVVSSFLGFFAWYAGLARGGVAKIGQVQLAQAPLTLVWSALVLGERIDTLTAVTALVVLASVAAIQRTRVERVPAGS